jgi:hypothetical protein
MTPHKIATTLLSIIRVNFGFYQSSIDKFKALTDADVDAFLAPYEAALEKADIPPLMKLDSSTNEVSYVSSSECEVLHKILLEEPSSEAWAWNALLQAFVQDPNDSVDLYVTHEILPHQLQAAIELTDKDKVRVLTNVYLHAAQGSHEERLLKAADVELIISEYEP